MLNYTYSCCPFILYAFLKKKKSGRKMFIVVVFFSKMSICSYLFIFCLNRHEGHSWNKSLDSKRQIWAYFGKTAAFPGWDCDLTWTHSTNQNIYCSKAFDSKTSNSSHTAKTRTSAWDAAAPCKSRPYRR